MIDYFFEKLKFKDLKEKNLLNYQIQSLKINNEIMKYINHISPENVNYILKLIADDEWISKFNDKEIDKILFISRFFKPICVWHSDYHKKNIPFLKCENINSKIEYKKKSNNITKDILENLIKKKSDNIKSITIGDSSIPSFLQSINEILGSSSKKKTIERNNNYKEIKCVAVLDGKNIKIGKNSNSMSLMEDKYGLQFI